jgi:hypothetical protein
MPSPSARRCPRCFPAGCRRSWTAPYLPIRRRGRSAGRTEPGCRRRCPPAVRRRAPPATKTANRCEDRHAQRHGGLRASWRSSWRDPLAGGRRVRVGEPAAGWTAGARMTDVGVGVVTAARAAGAATRRRLPAAARRAAPPELAARGCCRSWAARSQEQLRRRAARRRPASQGPLRPATSVKRKVSVPVGSGGPGHVLIAQSIRRCPDARSRWQPTQPLAWPTALAHGVPVVA